MWSESSLCPQSDAFPSNIVRVNIIDLRSTDLTNLIIIIKWPVLMFSNTSVKFDDFFNAVSEPFDLYVCPWPCTGRMEMLHVIRRLTILNTSLKVDEYSSGSFRVILMTQLTIELNPPPNTTLNLKGTLINLCSNNDSSQAMLNIAWSYLQLLSNPAFNTRSPRTTLNLEGILHATTLVPVCEMK